ncbi:hypothetical protein BDD12DRAFT_832381 [Trichophaea hybrida]|nr:hypothetical protein BDD12DRAFT_832381 [Trichophaea hybrida]
MRPQILASSRNACFIPTSTHQKMSRTIPQLSKLAITLRLSPPPKSLTESRALLKTLQRFGQVTAFKALRFPSSLQTFTPTTHVLFSSPESVVAVKNAAPLRVGGMEVSVAEDFGRWGGREHEEYLIRASAVVQDEDGGWEALNIARASGGGFGGKPGKKRRAGKDFGGLGGSSGDNDKT